MGFCHQKDLFRIESKPAFYLSGSSYTKRKFRFIFYENPPSRPCSKYRKKKILHIKKKRWGARSDTKVGINYLGVHI